MVEIKLENWQRAYDVIEEYIRRYWKRYNMVDTVVASIGISYDGNTYEHRNEVACPYNGDVEFLNDWWEGEKFIRLFGIISLDGINISGGIYND